MHLQQPPLTLRRILTFWGVAFLFILFSGLCWTAFLLVVFWIGGQL